MNLLLPTVSRGPHSHRLRSQLLMRPQYYFILKMRKEENHQDRTTQWVDAHVAFDIFSFWKMTFHLCKSGRAKEMLEMLWRVQLHVPFDNSTFIKLFNFLVPFHKMIIHHTISRNRNGGFLNKWCMVNPSYTKKIIISIIRLKGQKQEPEETKSIQYKTWGKK